jgi:hypothetical protein
MNEDRREKRKAYEVASTYYRAYYELYYPAGVLGGRPAEPVTPDVLLEIERLKKNREAAQAAWEASMRS